MDTALKTLLDEIQLLRLDQALLFLNHLMGVSNGLVKDPRVSRLLDSFGGRAPSFLIRFLAKHVILRCSVLGRHDLTEDRFRLLLKLYFDLDDPISTDPNWKHADPTGFFVRFFSQQMPAQRQRYMRDYGLALGLFRDAGTSDLPGDYSLRADLETDMGLTIEQFMSLGFVCSAICGASKQNPGTVTYPLLAEAHAQGLEFVTPETWKPFLSRVACTPDQFRQTSDQSEYRVRDDRFEPFAFNPLSRYPLIEVESGRFIAVDPALVVERTTWGLFYDLFERDRLLFSQRFGDVFARLVGELLETVCSRDSLWSAVACERQGLRRESPRGKRGDWAYRGEQKTVLFECKSLRPNLELTTYGSEEHIEETAGRIADALAQLAEQDVAIQRGEWKRCGLTPSPTLHVVLTYGDIITINGSFFRRRIRAAAAQKGFKPRPFAVLSLSDLDTLVRLVELCEPLEQVVSVLCERESFEIFGDYQEKLASHMISSYATKRGGAFLSSIRPHAT